ncbi:MAG: GNAT family N-acetyltransferase [Xanthomonadales bacterium]|nr:GNAT family N-acetyltransferase [Xanthomonadales bacterium]
MEAVDFNVRTSRLELREFQASDAEALYALNSDPKVLRYTGEQPFPDVAAAAAFIDGYTHYRDYGFGRWAVIHLDSGAFMGFCGLRRQAAGGPVDLAFRLFPRYWAKGYATEAANAALAAGFGQFGLEEITGRAMRENLPSISILQNLGMRFQSVQEEHGLIWLVYVIGREEFNTRA